MIDIFDLKENTDNFLDIPPSVGIQVRISQIIALLIASWNQDELRASFRLTVTFVLVVNSTTVKVQSFGGNYKAEREIYNTFDGINVNYVEISNAVKAPGRFSYCARDERKNSILR